MILEYVCSLLYYNKSKLCLYVSKIANNLTVLYLINTYDITNILGCMTVIMYFSYFIVRVSICNVA